MPERQPNINKEKVSNPINIKSKEGIDFNIFSDNNLDMELKKELVHSLIQQSQEDDLILKNTSDKKRFNSIEAFNKWREEKKPMIYWLVNKDNKLSGLIWFRKHKNKDKIWTFAIRTYNDGRGGGLSYPFMRESHRALLQDLIKEHKAIKSILLETNSNNGAAIRIYKRLGYKIRDKRILSVNRDIYRMTMKLKSNQFLKR